MPVNEEKWIAHCEATKAEYDKWNEEQLPENKILVRSPFDVELPNIKLLAKKEDPYEAKNGQAAGINVYQPVKAVDSQGTETAWKIQLPTANAPRGYCTIKHDKGEMKVIPIVLDTRNPDHRCFINQYEDKMMTPIIRAIMETPSFYGNALAAIKPISKSDFSQETLNSVAYQVNMGVLSSVLTRLIRKPNISKGIVDEKSLLRNMFLNPLNYRDQNKPNEPPVECRISWKRAPLEPPISIGLNQLYDLCEGIKRDETGKKISQKAMGFQCSPELSVSKINIGVKISCKTTCTALTIYTFFESKIKDSQAEKHAYVDEHVSADIFKNSMNDYISEMLKGLSTTEEEVKKSPVGNSFNPFADTTNLTEIPEGSLLATITPTPLPVATVAPTNPAPIPVATIISQPAPTNPTPVPVGAKSPNEALNHILNTAPPVQQNFNMIPPAINQSTFPGMPPPPAFPTSGMPPPFNMQTMSGDRINSFNPSMIPVQNSGGTI